jgi:hypothetical protein
MATASFSAQPIGTAKAARGLGCRFLFLQQNVTSGEEMVQLPERSTRNPVT